MTAKSAEITTHLITVMCLCWGVYIFKKKATEDPGQKIMGFSLKTITTICYVGIVIAAALALNALFK